MIHIFRDVYHLRVLETGLKHGTITVCLSDGQYEVTTFRIDGEYSDNRHPDNVQFAKEISTDLERRDFTINALAYSPTRGIQDLHDGYADIQRKIVRCVGNPDDRFQEDALRILRAIRFSVTLNFGIDYSTQDAIKRNMHLLSHISAERINSELVKILSCFTSKQDSILMLIDCLDNLIPEFSNCDYAYIYECLVMSNDSIYTKLAQLFNLDSKKLEIVLRKLRFDNDTIKKTLLVHKYGLEIKVHEFDYNKVYYARKILNKCGSCALSAAKFALSLAMWERDKPRGDDIKGLIAAIYFAEGIDCYQISDLDISGYDLIDMGLRGKEIGDTLDLLLDMVMRDDVENERSKLIIKAKEEMRYRK